DLIEAELVERLKWFKEHDKLVEAQRLEQRTRFDLEMIRELGYCNGIENYSRYLSGRAPGSRRRRCSTICRRMRWLSSMSRMCRFRKLARCTRATARARKRWSNMVFACRPRWITGRCVSTNGNGWCRS